MTTTRGLQLWRVVWILALFLSAAGCGESSEDWECAADARALCPEQTQRPEMVTCLRAKQAKLSESCSERIATELEQGERDKSRRILGIACSEDVERFCDDMARYADREAVSTCLYERQDELMPDCRNKLRTKIHQRVGRLYDLACGNDIDEYCDDLDRNAAPPEVSACLDEHREAIADTCKDMIDGKILSKRKQQELDRKAARARKKAAMGTEPTPDPSNAVEAE